MKLTFYPAFADELALSDHYYRLHWYLFPFRDEIQQIILPRRSDALGVRETSPYLDANLRRLDGSLPVALRTAHDDKQLGAMIDDADCVLVWSVDPKHPHARAPALNGKPVVRVDHNNLRFAGSYYLKFAERFEAIQAEYLPRAREIFERIHGRCSSEVGYIFGTGPNLSQADAHDFSDGISIACNSMVRNRALLDRLNPPLIVIADPIFHAGPSSYAGAFRNALVGALDRYGADLIVPMRDYHIYLSHLPERFSGRVAAIPFRTAETPNLDLDASFHVTSTPNVLTLFLLPLASTFFNEIRIFGCDGRSAEANSYFWGHDKASQFNEEMADIKQAHPAFFAIDYDDYYAKHCETLEKWLAAAEARGKRITNWTPSYIPALRRRPTNGAGGRNAGARRDYDELISVDPDALNHFGHYLAYDQRLAEEADRRGLKFSIIGNKNFELDESALRAPFLRALTIHSWRIGNPRTNALQSELDAFGQELREALGARPPARAGARTMLYMYCGSLEHAEIFEDVLARFPDVDANINLFWASFADLASDRAKQRWAPALERILKSGRIALTAPTVQLQAEFLTRFNVDLPLAPHPSSTFGDEEAAKFVGAPAPDKSGDRITVLFPGGMRIEKGFDLTVETANRLAGLSQMNCLVRARPGASMQPRIRAIRELIDRERVQTSDEKLTNEEFIDFLAKGDIIVLPYRAPEFSGRTSGLLIDAMLIGRPVVVLKDTWLSEIVEQFGVGVSASGDSDSIVEAIGTAAAQYDRLKCNIERFRTVYFEKNSWAALVNTILTPVRSEQLSERSSDQPGPASEAIARSGADPTASLTEARDELIGQLPPYLRSGIFLPTDRIPIAGQIEGLRRVKALYDSDLDGHRKRLRDLKASRENRRCFIIGNGPSLRNTDLSKLEGEATFATNGFFLKMPELNWAPSFYVVEDHLVAEDRANEINKLRGPVKLFPANLRYVLEPDEDTIFFDHRPRKSFPDGFDFSVDADDHTYAGGTVTFTCLQLAAYLGFKEIYLIGVDANYAIPADATISGAGRVKEIDMTSDDPNHFHPDYFGKGKRWHEPNVDVMLAAYAEAKRACDERGVRIFNATLGGRLEVFPRVGYESLFDDETDAPRLLLIDSTRIGNRTATGELKAALLAGWPQTRLLQLFDAGHGLLGFYQFEAEKTFIERSPTADSHIRKRIEAFQPELILYRPTPDVQALHQRAMGLIRQSHIPCGVWIMDDWPTALARTSPEQSAKLDKDLRALLARATRCFSISEVMSEAFSARYGVPFLAFANGVDPAEWRPAQERMQTGALKLRYAGSLAQNMTLHSVRLLAEAVETLSAEGVDIVFEIKTSQIWHERAAVHFDRLPHTTFFVVDLPPEGYREWLQAADIVAIAYNFDEASRDYIRFSTANKLPECLASGAALLAVGPPDVATMQVLAKLDCGVLVTQDDAGEVAAALRALAASPDRRRDLAQKAQRTAFERFNITEIRAQFRRAVTEAASEMPRLLHGHVDETAVVAHLLQSRRGLSHLMLDVGAHFGTSASYFRKLDWTVHCFEPDPANRTMLCARFRGDDAVTIDARAVSDRPAHGVAFFASDESTGISGLSAFRPTHKETTRVEVTTVAEIVAEQRIDHIDFLKIDVEGFDFAVLKGVPWERLKPDVVECEFEDAKTLPMGHSWRDIADFLREQGYAVYVSEWYPIVRYGVPHDWRRVTPYPGFEISAGAWGNLLGFREDPGYSAVRAAFRTLVKTCREEPSAKSSPAAAAEAAPIPSDASPPPPARRPARFGELLLKISPRLFVAARLARRAAAGVWRRRLWTVPALALVALTAALGFVPALSNDRFALWGAGVLAALSLAVLYLALRIYQFVNALSAEIASLRSESDESRASIRTLTKHWSSTDSRLSTMLDAVHRKAEDATQALAQRTDHTETALAALQADLARLDARDAGAAEKAAKEFAALQADLARLDARDAGAAEKAAKEFAALWAEIGAFNQRYGGLDEATGALEAKLVEASAAAKQAAALADKAAKSAPPNNAALYQSFNRKLAPAQLEIFDKEWGKRLSVNTSRQTLGYMANRACQVEAMCEGRLATTIEDILLRTLVGLGVKSRTLEVLEIGTLFGVGVAIMRDALAPHFDKTHFTLIDPLDGYYDAAQKDVLTGQPVNEATLRRNLRRTGFRNDELTLIKRLSTDAEAIREAGAREYDVLVIDGDHSYGGVKADFENYARFVKLGGYIVFDDYGASSWPDVAQYVDSEVAPLSHLAHAGTSFRTCVYRVARRDA